MEGESKGASRRFTPSHKLDQGIRWPLEEGYKSSSGITSTEYSSGEIVKISFGHELGAITLKKDGDDLELLWLNVEPKARGHELGISSSLLGILKGFVVAHPDIKTVSTVASNEATIALVVSTLGRNGVSFDQVGEAQSNSSTFKDMGIEDAIHFLQKARKTEYPDDPNGSSLLQAGIKMTVDVEHLHNTYKESTKQQRSIRNALASTAHRLFNRR